MRNRLQVFMAVVLLGAGTAQALPMVYTASLTGAAENPPNASPGTGFAQVEYDALTHLLHVQVNFDDLIGITTAAHIHCCVDAPGNVGVATPTPSFPGFPLGVTSGAYDHNFRLDLALQLQRCLYHRQRRQRSRRRSGARSRAGRRPRLFQHPHDPQSGRRDPGLSCGRAGTRHLAAIGTGRCPVLLSAATSQLSAHRFFLPFNHPVIPLLSLLHRIRFVLPHSRHSRFISRLISSFA